MNWIALRRQTEVANRLLDLVATKFTSEIGRDTVIPPMKYRFHPILRDCLVVKLVSDETENKSGRSVGRIRTALVRDYEGNHQYREGTRTANRAAATWDNAARIADGHTHQARPTTQPLEVGRHLNAELGDLDLRP